MAHTSFRESQRQRRHHRGRKKIVGSPERPRLVVHRSHLNLSAQIVDDFAGKTLITSSTLQEKFQKASKKGGNLAGAKVLGGQIAEAALAAGIKAVVLDRGGYPYHGRIKALADAAREKGLQF